MADQNRNQQAQDEPGGQQSDTNQAPEWNRDDEQSPAMDESERERSTREPPSTAHDRGLDDELDSESEVDELDEDTDIEDEDISSR